MSKDKKGAINMYSNAASVYQEKSISTASSPKLLLMLYEGAIKFCRFAEIAIDEKNMEARNKNLIKVQNIISELTVTLNLDAGEIAEQLSVLYDYMQYETMQANIHNDKEKVTEVKKILEELRDTWGQIIN